MKLSHFAFALISASFVLAACAVSTEESQPEPGAAPAVEASAETEAVRPVFNACKPIPGSLYCPRGCCRNVRTGACYDCR